MFEGVEISRVSAGCLRAREGRRPSSGQAAWADSTKRPPGMGDVSGAGGQPAGAWEESNSNLV